MPDSNKSKKALLEEVQALRSRVAELERIQDQYKRTEQALRESQEQYARAEQIGHFGHWERNLVEDKATWSEESYRILGVDPNKFEPAYESFLDLVHPCDRDRVKREFEAASSHGKRFDIEYRIVRPDGAERVLHSVAGVRSDKSGRPLKLVGTAHDITERKQAEQELRKAHDELERRVEERTAALAKTNVFLKEQIAERKQTNEALRQSEEKWRTLVENAPDVIMTVDTDGTILFLNHTVPPFTPEKAVGTSIYDYVLAEYQDTLRKSLEHVLRTGEPYSYELAGKGPHGRTSWYQSRMGPIKHGGQVVAVILIATDITEHKQAEEKLKQYRFMVESAHDAIFFKDLKSRYVITNNKTLEAFGLSREQVIGKNDIEIMPNKEEAGKNIEDDKLVFETGKPRETTKHMTSVDGEERWFQAIKVPQFDEKGNVIGLIGIARDITEHKRDEEALRESEEKFRTFMETASDLMHIADKDAYFTYVNEATAVALGYSKEEMLGIHITDILSEGTKKDFEPRLKKLIGEGEVRADSVWVTKEGKEICGEITLVAVYDSDGEFAGARAIFRDITERKRAEEALQKARDELETRVEQRTAELARANEQLLSLASELSLAEERLRRRIATDVHDHIGQNLAISKIKLESLRKSMSSHELAVALDEIRELIAQTIESSRSLTFELSPPVLYELGFEAAVEWLVRQARQQHGLSAEFKSDGRSKPLSHDVSVLLFQAVRELLVNVAKHAQAQNVTVRTRRVADEIQVIVEDDGVGFDTSKTTSRDYQTGGFGLFSIRERLRSIGGRFDIESRPGAGTRVTLAAHVDNGNEDSGEKRK